MNSHQNSGYMADHLDGLAASIDGPIPPSATDIARATLRGLSHVARVSDETLHRIHGVERRVEALEKRDGKLDALEKRLAELERRAATAEAKVSAAWWTVAKVAGAVAFLSSSAFSVYQIFKDNGK